MDPYLSFHIFQYGKSWIKDTIKIYTSVGVTFNMESYGSLDRVTFNMQSHGSLDRVSFNMESHGSIWENIG